VADFLRDMAHKARPFAQRDVDELREFARQELGLAELEPWDLSWASEKLKQQRYSFSDEEVKQYFPEPKVLAGLFRVIESLFAVKLQADTAPAWHSDVRFFRIERDGRLIGQFYLDLYARETKRGGAWMDEAITRRRVAAGVQTPVAYLNCNFPAPVGGRPATFSHDDVITLFHECGHGLHHLLTQVEELPVSGIHGVEWDAVELPSQFMENYCWEWDVLTGMTAHADTGAPLPRALYDRMIAAKNFQSGMFTLRQVEFGLFDLLVHGAPAGRKGVMDLLATVRAEVAVLLPPEWNRFPHSFSHIFAGGYAAGYYSYKWAEVLSADAYEAFEEAAKGKRHDIGCENRRAFLAGSPRRRRLASGAGIVPGVSRARPASGCAATAQRDGGAGVIGSPGAVPSAPSARDTVCGPAADINLTPQPPRTRLLNSRSSRLASPLLSSTKRRRWVMLSMSMDLQRRPTWGPSTCITSAHIEIVASGASFRLTWHSSPGLPPQRSLVSSRAPLSEMSSNCAAISPWWVTTLTGE
jgi:hypothetical protein